eukprot:c14430_g1_i1 orf=376-1530(+)
MHQYLHSVAQDGGNAFFSLAHQGRSFSHTTLRLPLHRVLSARISQRSLPFHKVLSAPISQRSHGSLRCRLQKEGLSICMSSKNPLNIVSCSTNDILITDSVQEKPDSVNKIIRACLPVALAAGLVALAGPESALASAQLVLPNTGNTSIAATSGKEILVSAWMGLMAGCLHTLTGPDHLAALAPLSIGRTKLESVAVGALWGCGHDAGQVIFGSLFLLLKGKLHIEVLRTWGARVVGMTLIAIGIIGIREAQEAAVPCFAGEGSALSSNMISPSESSGNAPKKNLNFATFATGIVHGLQPDALIMILPALALPSRLAGAAFLIMFLVGTVLAMSSYTAFIGSCSQALKKRIPRITEHLSWFSSGVAIFVGVGILASELFGFSLL